MANIGRAPNTIDAYGRAVEDHLRFCAAEGTEPLYAKPDTVAAWIGEMLERPPSKLRGKGAAPAGSGLERVSQIWL
ncbi:hypothetical protein [Streptomyces sp. CB03234]|uniref:hypothetical protein n=1 Tax=Streptomyces sp. (strain CB03234) TaxID=1703937 RepID=UPI00117D2794|nr:hypothetical protein [Streptomyces sp. CB03234]